MESASNKESKISEPAEPQDIKVCNLSTVSCETFNDEVEKVSRWRAFKDGFKRIEVEELDPNLTAAERIAVATAKSPLQRHLKSRHLQMIAIGGSIGTGLFVGSGTALSSGGPAGVLIGWGLIGTMIYCVVMAAGELAVRFPVSGGFTTYTSRFVDESFAFACNFNYMLAWLVTLPLELVAASITIDYWGVDRKYRDAFVALFYIVIIIINMFGVKGYGEAEFVFSMVKVLTIIGFIILGIVLVCGGGPQKGYIGGKYWHNPGAFYGDTAGQRFKGVCTVFVTASFSFSGSELVALAAAETQNPRKTLPKAAKQVFWRISLFYIISLALVGLLVPYTNDKLLGGASSVDATASPFVLAIEAHGIKGLPSVFNVVILLTVLSVGNSSVFGCSRSITALAEQGSLPEVFGYIDRKGRPIIGIVITAIFGLLSFIAASDKQGDVFNWLIAICGLASLFSWGGICICHLRFRRALAVQGRSTNELAFTSPAGIWGSIYGLVLVILVLVVQFWIALFPVGGSPNAENFFEAYLSFVLALVMYVGHKIYTRSWKLFIRAKDMDLDTGRLDTDTELLQQTIAEEREALRKKPIWYRAYQFWC